MSAQNAWVEADLVDPTHHYDSNTGAFTGEVSAEMLEDLGIPYAPNHHVPTCSTRVRERIGRLPLAG